MRMGMRMEKVIVVSVNADMLYMWMWCSWDAKWSKIRLWIMFVDIVYHETTKCQYLYLDH